MTLASKTESEGFFFTLSGLSGMRHGQRGDVHVGPGARSSDGLAPRFLLHFPGRGRLPAGARCTERGNLPVPITLLLLPRSPLLKWHGKIDSLWLVGT